jgi:DNA-binding NtrC family response regulator
MSLDDRLWQFERDLIASALRIAVGNVTKAARLLKIRRSTLADRVVRYGLKPAKDAAGPRSIRASA